MAEDERAIRVVIADDHPIVAEGLRRFFVAVEGVTVVATAASVDSLVAKLTDEVGVDLVVLDVDFPGMAGGATVRAIRERGPQVLIFTHQAPDELVASMVLAGARGFVSKSDPVDELVAAMRAVHAGGEWTSEPLRALVKSASSTPPHERLTERELAVFALLARGRSPKEIGFELALSPSTVYAHVERVRSKLGVASAIDVERYAARWGIVRG